MRKRIASWGRASANSSYDPIYTLLFMAADFLPSAGLSALGVWDVKCSSVLVSSRIRTPAG
jgi:hypothetical protein